MGKTDLKTPWSPTSSRLSGATSAWRNFSYDCFWMLMRFGMSMIFWIFAKLFRVRKLFWTVAGIRVSQRRLGLGQVFKRAMPATLSWRSRRHAWDGCGSGALAPGDVGPGARADSRDYLISTVAPAAVSWSLIFLASS